MLLTNEPAASAGSATVLNDTNHAASDTPVKTREIQNHHQDSRIWNDFKFRPDDIIIATYAKSGTTWMQQIVSQLVHSGDPTVAAGVVSPWVDLRFVPRDLMLSSLEAQTGRRFVKTHLYLDALVWNTEAKYIYIVRDGRDMIWSLHHHFTAATEVFYQMVNDSPGRVGPPYLRPTGSPRDILLDLVEDDTRPSIPWPFWSHVRGWWSARNQPNLLLVHFNDLKVDMEGEMRRIAQFLKTPEMSPDDWKAAVEHCTFQWMKDHAEMSAPPQSEVAFEEGAKSFINKGTNGRWKDILSEEDSRRYLEKARQELGEECALFLEKGRLQ